MSNNIKKNNLQTNKGSIARNSNAKSNKGKRIYEEEKKNYYLIPLFLILCIVPLIIRMKVYNPNFSQFLWFDQTESFTDFFLYYKQWSMVFIAAIMGLLIAYKAYVNRSIIRFSPIFIPLALYALLALLSAVFSKYAFFSLRGSFEQFESVFALLGYCLIAYYAFLFVNSECDLKLFTIFIIAAALIMSFLGVLQFLGHDFFGTKAGLKMILPSEYHNGAQINFTFGEKRVYLTLYNPNYVGVYVSLIIPILVLLLLFMKDVKLIILTAIATIGLIISAVGSQSLSGIISLGATVIFVLVFMWRNLIRRYYITIPIAIILVISLFVMNNLTNHALDMKLRNVFQNTASTYPISEMDTNEDSVSLIYKGNKLYVQYIPNDDNTATLLSLDENMQTVACTYDQASNTLMLTDERFAGITLGVLPDTGLFYISIEGLHWRFTNQTGDGTYYYLNNRGKLDKMITAPSAIFTGHEFFASGRGYIWSRTIPLLKKYIFLGSGPDTYTMAFPQSDYMNLIKYGYGGAVLTKPHSLYLQIGVQTGVLSLVAFLLFYGMYFVSSIRLYIRGLFNSVYAKTGVAIFIGTISYMIAGLTNDSSITTAPVFWVLIGTGIAVNYKVKPMIQEEVAFIKESKIELRKSKANKAENV